MVQAASARKNIWVAASDGDIDRVRDLIEKDGLSPNVKDSNSYTPIHAAASYHHFDLLEYLISVGGDINLRDDEGETPLFTVEGLEAAQWLVEHGADPAATNDEGQSAADYHEDEHPEIAEYLRSLAPNALTDGSTAGIGSEQIPSPGGMDGITVSESNVDEFTSHQTNNLIEETQRIMREAELTGENPDERLREVVQRAVAQGLTFGGELGAKVDEEDEGRKRTRTQNGGGGTNGA